MSEQIEGYKPSVEELQGRATESISAQVPTRDASNVLMPASEPRKDNGRELEAVRRQLRDIQNWRAGGKPRRRVVEVYNPTPDGLGPLEWWDKITARARRNAQEASEMKEFSWWGLFLAILGGILSAPANAAIETVKETQEQEGYGVSANHVHGVERFNLQNNHTGSLPTPRRHACCRWSVSSLRES